MDNLDKALAPTVEKLLQYATDIEAFAKKEVPLYIQELLNYKFWSEMFDIIFWGAPLLILSIIFFIWGAKQAKESGVSSDAWTGNITLGVIFFIVAVIVVYFNAGEIVKIKLAPRVYVLEYLRSLK